MHRDFIDSILAKEYKMARDIFDVIIENVLIDKLEEMKKSIMAEVTADELGSEYEVISEAGRWKMVRARIRNGKVQRRKKVSNVKGYTFRSGKLTRMSPAERRRRKLSQRRGALKRRSKMKVANMKRKRSLKRRKALGV